MKNKFSLFIVITLLFSRLIFSQEDSNKAADTINIWIPAAAVGINVSQLALSNWSQGGENSLTWVLIGNGGINYIGEKWNFRNNLKLAYGRTKIGTQDFRTNDNELYLESVLSRKFGWEVDPYISNTVRSSITKGYKYDINPPVIIADFFDPGYLTQSIGFIYDKQPNFNTRLGFAVQETFTKKQTQYSDDIETAEVEKLKIETGLESVTKFEYKIEERLIITSLLRLFTRYKNLDVWDVRWDNSIVSKITEYINVNFSVLVVYEQSQSLKTQIKEALQLGLLFTLL